MKDVTPLLMHWSYVYLALTNRLNISQYWHSVCDEVSCFSNQTWHWDILVCIDWPISWWWEQMPWHLFGARASTTTKSQLWIMSHKSHYVKHNLCYNHLIRIWKKSEGHEFIVLCHLQVPLQRCHGTVMAPQITGNMTVCLTTCSS